MEEALIPHEYGMEMMSLRSYILWKISFPTSLIFILLWVLFFCFCFEFVLSFKVFMSLFPFLCWRFIILINI